MERAPTLARQSLRPQEMERKWAIAALVLAFAPGCMGDGETVDVADEETDAPAERSEPPVPPEREPERGDCEPIFYKQPDGTVIPIPVECQIIPFDKGDPPDANPVEQRKDILENPAELVQEV